MDENEKADATILRYSVLAGVADITPIVGADLAVVLACQLKMYYALADQYGVSVTKARFREMVVTLAGAIGSWWLTIIGATAMIKAFPGVGSLALSWQPPMIAAFTWAMGQVLKQYFPSLRAGRAWTGEELRLYMREVWATARAMDWKEQIRNPVGIGREEVRGIAEAPAQVPIPELPYDERRLVLVRKKATRQFLSAADVLIVPLQDAVRELTIPAPGHPQANTLYIGHPYRARVYYPAPDFHRRLCDDKSFELIQLLAALGATRVSLHEQEGYGYNAGIEGGLGGAAGPAEYSLNAKVAVGKKSGTASEQRFDFTPAGPPHRPKDMVWYDREERWKHLAQMRLESGMDSCELSFEYTDDFGITVEMIAGIDGFIRKISKLSVKGSYTSYKKTSWRLNVEFGKFGAGQPIQQATA